MVKRRNYYDKKETYNLSLYDRALIINTLQYVEGEIRPTWLDNITRSKQTKKDVAYIQRRIAHIIKEMI